MLNDLNPHACRSIYLACGYTDLRYGIDGLAGVVSENFHLNPFDKGTLFLFCGRRADRIKGLFWEGDGFLLLYKRLENGRFQWPRTPEEARKKKMLKSSHVDNIDSEGVSAENISEGCELT